MKSIRPSTRPVALKRNSPLASRSSNSITYGSRNTFAAVRKSTPCFFRLANSLALSHSKSIAGPDLDYTDIQYLVQDAYRPQIGQGNETRVILAPVMVYCCRSHDMMDGP